MIQLNQTMMERYEIAARRPECLRAVFIGADSYMLGCAARVLEDAGVGAACVGTNADRLRAQDGMFTCLIRANGARSERVIQSIVRIECEPDGMRALAQTPGIDSYMLNADAADADFAVMIAMLKSRMEAGIAAPDIFILSSRAMRVRTDALAGVIRAALGNAAWCEGMRIIRVLTDHLCGALSESERAIEQRTMNYRDDFILWAEKHIALTADSENDLFAYGGFEAACEKKARIFDAAAFLAGAVGYLYGKDTFAEAMADQQIRDFVAHAFYDELMPRMRADAEAVISAFERLEEPMNALPILSGCRYALSGMTDTVLPAIRACARDEFDVPPRTALAVAAAIMLYCGARYDEETRTYRVLRGEGSDAIIDDPSFLDAFARMSHDMPAESIAYAVLADRSLWGEDLREIDGLEMRVTSCLSIIQRTGIKDALKIISA